VRGGERPHWIAPISCGNFHLAVAVVGSQHAFDNKMQ
jgi:hypothetical protein